VVKMVVDKIFIAEHGQARLGAHGKIIQIFLISVFSVNCYEDFVNYHLYHLKTGFEK